MTRQEEIKMLIHNYGIKQSWLAKKLGLKKQTFSYLLNESNHFDEAFYDRIKEIIKEYQFELELFEEENSESLDLFNDDKIQIGIGERIRIFAKRKYGTFKSLAAAMEISPQQLQQYISGRREPGSKILIKLLRLGCDINWLLGGSESLESYKLFKLEGELRQMQDGLNQIAGIIDKLDARN